MWVKKKKEKIEKNSEEGVKIRYKLDNRIEISLRHQIIDNQILIETMLSNLLANYFCDKREIKDEILFLVFQGETFNKKINLFKNLKLYERGYISCKKEEYEKAINSMNWINSQRNNVSHNPIILDKDEKNPVISVVRQGIVNRVKIDKNFIKTLDKNYNTSISLLAGLLYEVMNYKGFVQDGSKKIVE